jgi:NADH-ubiquinone oxidoreductase chain 5
VLNISTSPYSHLIIISIIVAGITKSAQIPFSRWLPAAIAAPTPVSALVHSSTLVTAGVFLLIRFYPFLHTFSIFNPILLIISSLTILIAGTAAIIECDLKKIIALSTLSQLGVIIAAIGINFPILAFFHLLTHALFKALLFICAGSLIHHHHHTQDLRQIGNIFPQMPLTTSCLLTANIALCGIPFITGFYSKDLILEFSLFHPINYTIILIFFIATILTAAYSARIIFISI